MLLWRQGDQARWLPLAIQAVAAQAVAAQAVAAASSGRRTHLRESVFVEAITPGVLLAVKQCKKDVFGFEHVEWLLQQVLNVNPGHAEAHYELGRLYREEGPDQALDKAETHWQQALAAGFEVREVNNELGLLYADWDFHGFSVKKADRHLREAWAKGHDEALEKLGELFEQAGDTEKAEGCYWEVHNRGWGLYLCWCWSTSRLAALLYKKGRREDGFRLFFTTHVKRIVFRHRRLCAHLRDSVFWEGAGSSAEASRDPAAKLDWALLEEVEEFSHEARAHGSDETEQLLELFASGEGLQDIVILLGWRYEEMRQFRKAAQCYRNVQRSGCLSKVARMSLAHLYHTLRDPRAEEEVSSFFSWTRYDPKRSLLASSS